MKANQLVLGILAHVDAGKTTLAESILYLTGSIRRLGRVDHGDAFLDTDKMERARGITIFSKQAQLTLGEKKVTLLDTPGHVDFSAEMERTLQVMDYAVLVINGADGVQSHTLTLWRLLKYYRVPVFLFVNKMDQPGTDKERLLSDLKSRLDDSCIDFGMEDQESFFDQLAMCGETLMEEFLEQGAIGKDTIAQAIRERQIFPCFFGSALKIWGVEELLKGIEEMTLFPQYPEEFGAKIYKITRDAQGARLTHMKITGGRLKVKEFLQSGEEGEEGFWKEKTDQIRIYSGDSFALVQEAEAGCVCAVTGLTKTSSGQGLGTEASSSMPILEPVLTYQILPPEGCDIHKLLIWLRQLEEEEPHLHITWNEALGEIHAQVMGEIETEILKNMILERFGVEVEFGQGNLVYQETLKAPVGGVGHFEPLRHYAEVHLLLEPGEPGSGLQFDTSCSEDDLAGSWQRLILTHLKEKAHVGVLTGSEITDMKITVTAGRAHLKHTEGGDFRQATYRAVRQGLKKAESVLLEPVYEFRLELPAEMVGRAMADIQKRYGQFEPPVMEGDQAVLTGKAPVAAMRDYQREVNAYTRGQGRLFCTLKGYEPCHNAQEVIDAMGYDSELDMENPTGSVFCSHGAGFVVPWDQVEQYMHIESTLESQEEKEYRPRQVLPPASSKEEAFISQEEIDQIFAQTYGTSKREKNRFNRNRDLEKRVWTTPSYQSKPREKKESYLLVDGYNIIYAWPALRELVETNLDGARQRLMDILSDYQGYKKDTVILLSDAYKVKGGTGSVQKYHNIHVIYTKEAETADQYIEKAVHKMGQKYDVIVATSDYLEQMIIWGSGARRISAQGLLEEVKQMKKEVRQTYLSQPEKGGNFPFRNLSAKEFLRESQEQEKEGKQEEKKSEIEIRKGVK